MPKGGFVVPGFADREMDQPTVPEGIPVERRFSQLVGLEVKLERVDHAEFSLEINVEKILIQKYHLAAEGAEGGEDLMEGVVSAQIVQIENYYTGGDGQYGSAFWKHFR